MGCKRGLPTRRDLQCAAFASAATLALIACGGKLAERPGEDAQAAADGAPTTANDSSSPQDASGSPSDSPFAQGDSSLVPDATPPDARVDAASDATIADARLDGGLDAAPDSTDAAPDSTISDTGSEANGPDASAMDASDAAVPDAADADACTVCGSSCVDPTNDPHNCGACGHDCIAGGCVASSCTPFQIATGLTTRARSLAVGSGFLFWTDMPSVHYAPVTGGLGGSLVPTNSCWSWELVVVGSAVYWTCDSFSPPQVMTAGPYLSNPGTFTDGIANTLGYSIATDGTNLYWMYSTPGGQRGLLGCPLPDCAGGPTQLYIGGTPTPLVANNGMLYWSDPDAAQVAACPITGCGSSPTILATGQTSVGSLAVTRTAAYWSALQSGSIPVMICSLPDCGQNPIAFTPPGVSVYALAIDTSNVYWLTWNGLIQSCPLSGCGSAGPRTLTISPNTPVGQMMAVDDAAVYWESGYAIWGVAK